MEAWNARYEEFKASDYARRIELFEQTLHERLLMDGEMAFAMLGQLFDDAAERNEHGRYEVWVERLRTTVPEVYEEEAAVLLENLISNAIAMRRPERIDACAFELAALAGEQLETWLRAQSQLAYHGHLRTLIAAMRRAWPDVRDSEDILPWGWQSFGDQAIQFEIMDFLEQTPVPAQNDPALLERIRWWGVDIDAERIAEIVAWQSGQLERRWVEPDFRLRSRKRRAQRACDADRDESDDETASFGDEVDPGAQNLLHLTLQFVRYAHRIERWTFSKAELARSEIYRFVVQRQTGELEYRESMLDTALRESGRKRAAIKRFKPYTHLLCPDRERLDRYVAGLLGPLQARRYAAAALLESIPAWLRFLQGQGLIGGEECQRTLHELRSLAAHVLRLFKGMRDDPALHEAIRQCPEYATDEAGTAGTTPPDQHALHRDLPGPAPRS